MQAHSDIIQVSLPSASLNYTVVVVADGGLEQMARVSLCVIVT